MGEARAAGEEAGFGEDRLRELLAEGYDSAHAGFLYAQNFASFVAEELSALKELRPFATIVGKAEDDYLPSYPPLLAPDQT